MLTVKADSLTFPLPQSWDEVTFGQERLLAQATDVPAYLSILSGKPLSELRPLRAPDLADLYNTHLHFIRTRPDFQSLPPSKTLTIGKVIITIPTHLGSQTTYGQKVDIDQELKNMPLSDDDEVNLRLVAPLLLSVYLVPLLTNTPYEDIEQARAILPQLDSLPCTTALPIAAFFLRNYFSPTPSGRIVWQQSPCPMTPSVASWRLSIRRVLARLIPSLRFRN